MAYFVVLGKSVSVGRRIISGGESDSEITWEKLCRKPKEPEVVESAKRSLKRLHEAEILVEADSMPVLPEEIQAVEQREAITQHVPLSQSAAQELEPGVGDGPEVQNVGLHAVAPAAGATIAETPAAGATRAPVPETETETPADKLTRQLAEASSNDDEHS